LGNRFEILYIIFNIKGLRALLILPSGKQHQQAGSAIVGSLIMINE
jgi:hypothetical protein